MMATTHVLAGLVLASTTVLVVPEYAPVAILAAVVGSLVPDLNLYAGHRRTLHFPVYYSLSALCSLVLALFVPTSLTVAVAFFLIAAALHSVMDAFGGGLELRPWEAGSEQAVYDHFRGRWIRPRRWVRYDGAPEDLFLAVVLAIPSLALHSTVARALVLGLLGMSAIYTLVRKPLVVVVEWFVAVLPVTVVQCLPDRFTEDQPTRRI